MLTRKIDWIVIIAVIVLCFAGGSVLFDKQRDELEKSKMELLIAEQNWKADNDSLRTVIINQDSDIVYLKHVNLAQEQDMRKRLGDLETLNRRLQTKVNYYAEASAQVKHDTILIKADSIQQTDSIHTIFAGYKDKWTTFNTTTKYNIYDRYANMTVRDLCIKMPVKVGWTEDNQFFIHSPNPNVVISDIEGVSMIQKKKKYKVEFNHGLQLGLSAQYGLINKEFDVGPSIGYGVEIWF